MYKSESFLHNVESLINLQSRFATGRFRRELSSAGSEHLPYKQRVGGSNPSAPTLKATLGGFYRCMNFTFYILYSLSADRYYIGHTSEPIEERVRKQNSRHRGFTGKFIDWKIAYAELFETKSVELIDGRFR
jgi:putative endonuclease